MQNSETILQIDQNRTAGLKTSHPSFVAGVLALAAGAVIAQGIGLISSPIICRIFSPKEFGLAGIFQSIVGILGLLTCLRYELTIMLPKNKEDATTLFVFCCILIVIATGLVAIGAILWGPALMRLLEAEELIRYLWFAPICVFLAGMALTFHTWCNRQQKYRYLGY